MSTAKAILDRQEDRLTRREILERLRDYQLITWSFHKAAASIIANLPPPGWLLDAETGRFIEQLPRSPEDQALINGLMALIDSQCNAVAKSLGLWDVQEQLAQAAALEGVAMVSGGRVIGSDEIYLPQPSWPSGYCKG